MFMNIKNISLTHREKNIIIKTHETHATVRTQKTHATQLQKGKNIEQYKTQNKG